LLFYYAKEAFDYFKKYPFCFRCWKIEYNDSNATFSFDNYILMCRLIDGKYQTMKRLFQRKPNKLMIDRSQFFVPFVVLLFF
jgi:DNA polymerase III sliding clamp (beta) subunit (PCNA family)